MISLCVKSNKRQSNHILHFIVQGWNYLLPSGGQGWAQFIISHDHGNSSCKTFLTFSSTYLLVGKPYRSRKLGSQSLQLILAAAEAHTKPAVDRIYLHVQVSNEQAKKFYTTHGFKQVGIQQNYYRKIVPHDAWVLEKVFHRDQTELIHD